MNSVYKKLTVFGILQILDYITTMAAIKVGAVETNKIAYFFIQNNSLHILKIIGIIIICFFCIRAAKRNPVRVNKLLLFANIGYTLVAINNIIVYILLVKFL